jgi:argininosuccinate lyase
MTSKTWGGRFSEAPDRVALRFSQSVDVDSRLAREDIAGSIAHARMLGARGVISSEDAKAIAEGLAAIRAEIEAGRFMWDPEKEDVHMNIEAALTARIGEAGARLHTGRSRNDQVATDLRLFTRAACESTGSLVDHLIAVIALRARGSADVLLPGYTHLQRAQPVRLAHHLHAWCEMLERDRGRLDDARRRLNRSPLGAGALATTTFPIDREMTAKELGFDGVLANSLDAVSDRDFLVEVVAALANLAVHLSRIAEELVIWSTQEFGFVQMSDAFTTGSSMMPQKKNPDMAELVRGKTGRVIGDLVALLVMLKGLPLAYNRDLQEDKRPLFDAVDTTDACLEVLAGAIASARFDRERMRAALGSGFLEATEVADFLSDRGVPFRDAHHVAGRLVKLCVDRGSALRDLSLADYQAAHAAFDETVFDVLDPERAIERRDVVGGPAKARVLGAVGETLDRVAARGVDLGAVTASFGLEGST